jgi:hypothetical protein
MKRIVCITSIVVFACLLIAFYATNVTYAGEDSDKCAFCEKPADSQGKPVKTDEGTFCCKGCAEKYVKDHEDKSAKKAEHPSKHKAEHPGNH